MPMVNEKKMWMVLLLCGLMMGVGCDRDPIEYEPGVEDENGEANGQDDEEGNNDEESVWTGDYEASDQRDDDDEEASHPTGEMQGSWRAAYVEGDVPLAYFTVYHNEGEESARGDYLMAIARGEGLDGESGQFDDMWIDAGAEEVVIEWNPTPDQGEMYRLELQREDGETYVGEFSAEMYPNTHEVQMTLRDHSRRR